MCLGAPPQALKVVMSVKGDASTDLRALQNSFQSMKMDSGLEPQNATVGVC